MKQKSAVIFILCLWSICISCTRDRFRKVSELEETSYDWFAKDIIPFQDLTSKWTKHPSVRRQFGLENVRTGQMVLTPQHYSISKKFEAFIATESYYYYGMLDQHGRLILDLTYQSITEVAPDTVILEKINEWCVVNARNKPILKDTYMWIQYYEGGYFLCQDLREKYGLLDSDGNVMIPFNYDYLQPYFEEDFVVAGKGEDLFVMSTRGDTLSPVFSGASSGYSENVLKVKLHDRPNEFEFYDIKTFERIGDVYKESLQFREGICSVRKGDLAGCIDMSGRTVIPFVWGEIDHCRGGLMPVRSVSGKWGVINLKGDTIVPMEFSSVNLDHGFIRLSRANTSCLMNKRGEIIIPWGVDHFKTYRNGNAIQVVDDYGMLMDTCGTYAKHLLQFNISKFLSDRLILVKENGKKGLIDEHGTILLECKYDWFHFDRNGGYAIVKADGFFGYMDSDCRIVIPIQFDQATLFEHGFANVVKDGECYRIDEKGKPIPQLLED